MLYPVWWNNKYERTSVIQIPVEVAWNYSYFWKVHTVIIVRTDFKKVLMEILSLTLFYLALLRQISRGSFSPLFFPSFPFLSFLLPLERREKERTKEKENKDIPYLLFYLILSILSYLFFSFFPCRKPYSRPRGQSERSKNI